MDRRGLGHSIGQRAPGRLDACYAGSGDESTLVLLQLGLGGVQQPKVALYVVDCLLTVSPLLHV
jgi:hypothetical protein